jgi:O-succinylbenzoic acid--CoA ligase
VQIATSDTSCLLISSPTTENKWIETRDVVELISPGKFKLIGRLDRVINSGGIKVQPEKIEQAYRSICHLPLFVAGIPDEFWGEKVVLFVESVAMLDLPSLDHLLVSYEVPKEIVCLPSFIKTASAKIDTLKTVALYLNSQ